MNNLKHLERHHLHHAPVLFCVQVGSMSMHFWMRIFERSNLQTKTVCYSYCKCAEVEDIMVAVACVEPIVTWFQPPKITMPALCKNQGARMYSTMIMSLGTFMQVTAPQAQTCLNDCRVPMACVDIPWDGSWPKQDSLLWSGQSRMERQAAVAPWWMCHRQPHSGQEQLSLPRTCGVWSCKVEKE